MFNDLLNQPVLSSDPLSGYDVDQEQYVKHISTVRPSVKYGGGPVATKNALCVEMGGGVDQSDELIITGGPEEKTPKPRKMPKTIAGRPDEHLRFSDENVGDAGDNLGDARVGEEEEEAEGKEEVEQDVEEDEEPDSDDEENSLLNRPPEEQQEILAEISELEQALGPRLINDYRLIDRLGTGTFSSVYKALDLHYHTKWDNKPWHGHHPVSSSAYYQSEPRPSDSKVFVAIKRIYVTSSPDRIRNEISILEECRSCRHVSQLITAFRERDQVVVVMPYQRNEDFRSDQEYFMALPMEGIKSYFRCLFRALRDIHARKIIHRDVKPANFLFDPRTGIGTLCDFGLACRVEAGPHHDTCLHIPPSSVNPHGRIRDKKDYDSDRARRMSKDAKTKSGTPSERVGYLEKDPRPISKANRAGTRGFRAPEVLLKCGDQSGAIDMWSAGVILLFFLTRKFPLFQSNDDVEALMEIATITGKRAMERAAMLHSRTFSTNVPSVTPDGITWREFVVKQNPDLEIPPQPNARYYPYSMQLEAHQQRRLEKLDAEVDEDEDAEGDTDLSSPPSPLGFQSRLRSSSTAGTSSITFPTSPPKTLSSPEPELAPATPPRRRKPQASSQEFTPRAPSQASHKRDLENALSLVELLMDPDCTRRITPRNALYHPFLTKSPTRHGRGRSRTVKGKERSDDMDVDAEVEVEEEDSEMSQDESEPPDDEFVPHPFGKGVCGKYHFKDPVTEEPFVRVLADNGRGMEPGKRSKMKVVRLTSGEGVAIGREPCEFHRVGYELDMDVMMTSM
ncbi:Cell division control protein 7 [Marasmius crinis-equi]|uniref:non-specific serine/threonine protein kinase n=1 Tax=Marasmius crinis-equi TaxID=585013 RepID=A0ABR3FNF9_9AGAR